MISQLCAPTYSLFKLVYGLSQFDGRPDLVKAEAF